jgi:hypothetical protein
VVILTIKYSSSGSNTTTTIPPTIDMAPPIPLKVSVSQVAKEVDWFDFETYRPYIKVAKVVYSIMRD